MDSSFAMEVMQEGFVVALKLALPVLLVSLAIGLVVAIFQAATQIHEQTLSFAPKLLGIALVLLILGTWMITTISAFTYYVFDLMLKV